MLSGQSSDPTPPLCHEPVRALQRHEADPASLQVADSNATPVAMPLGVSNFPWRARTSNHTYSEDGTSCLDHLSALCDWTSEVDCILSHKHQQHWPTWRAKLKASLVDELPEDSSYHLDEEHAQILSQTLSTDYNRSTGEAARRKWL
jgi:hypothetical protein